MRCDQRFDQPVSPGIHVSIPAGFSDALRPSIDSGGRSYVVVSIPAGFSDALRPISVCEDVFSSWFQSLLGFLMRCDHISIYISG